MGIPLSMADVANVLRNLCGWTRGKFSLFQVLEAVFLHRRFANGHAGAVSETSNAEQVSVRLSR